jgi:hypothetical protein
VGWEHLVAAWPFELASWLALHPVGGVLVARGAVTMEKGVLSNDRAVTELRVGKKRQR